MTSKEPVLLTVLIETQALRWYVGGIQMNGQALPLLCSEPGNLSPYLGVSFDEQVTFLRHRLSGVLQRGCDRLWGRMKKPCQIVFVADGPFAQAAAELTPAVADHFVTWMTSPPVVFLTCQEMFAQESPGAHDRVVGELSAEHQAVLDAGLPDLVRATRQPDIWELVPVKPHPPP